MNVVASSRWTTRMTVGIGIALLGGGQVGFPAVAQSSDQTRYDLSQSPLVCTTGSSVILIGFCWTRVSLGPPFSDVYLGGNVFFPSGRAPLEVIVVDDVSGPRVQVMVCQDTNWDTTCAFPEPLIPMCGVGTISLAGAGFDNGAPSTSS